MTRLLLISVLGLIQTMGLSQVLTIDFPEHRFGIDVSNRIIVVQSYNIEDFADLSEYETIELVLTDSEFQFVEIPNNFQYADSYIVSDGTADYRLFYTRLPLIQIQNQGSIPDEPKVPAHFLYADSAMILSSTIGIETRGGVSQSYPKKMYGIEFWQNADNETPVNVQFGDLRNDDDWILDGMYNEPLRLRSYTAGGLWLDIHQPHYLSQEPTARAGVGAYYVELFLNGRYSGIYLLSERIDRKLLQVRKFDGNIRGEIYKGDQWGGAVSFSSLPAINNDSRFWGGHRMKYPKEEDTTNWQNLYGFTDFVLNSGDIEFEDVWSKFEYQNYLDYFIFLNMGRLTDNTGKNIYLAKLDAGAPYFYVPWDLDGCYGTIWNGTYDNTTDDILTNGFMNRVIATDVGNYSANVEARWAELRANALGVDNLVGRFQQAYDLLRANNIYERETLVYPNYSYDQESFDYITKWIEDRITFLDVYFNYDYTSLPGEITMKHPLIYPNPTHGHFNIQGWRNLNPLPFQIFDMQGKTVKSGIYVGQHISVAELDRGIYVFNAGNFRGKLVVD